MLRVAVPNKGSLSQTATHILEEAGYRMRRDSKDLTSWDEQNDVEFFFLRPKDIAIYVAKGHLDLGITGRDLAADSAANGVDELLALGFGASTFRYAAPENEEWNLNKIEGKRIATSYPHLVSADLAKRGIQADVIRLDGAVEISIRLGVADIIADVVSTGRTLRQQGLSPFGDVICTSEAIIVGRHNQPVTDEHQILLRRIEGILHAKNYLMIDYNCPKSLLAEATKLTPGLSAPTVSPLADDDWVAVRAMAPRKDANQLMDRLSALGAEAILATDIRIARLTR
ncbi:ATP phosphoribosyltransferase [Corynebacterium kroppenstedtii]|uniref:ATP phosphoribosyltransferase n=1 Tax=Corynebacterium kroppenstedtii (strain DSM 44385 / JCM 11950 / CIP 105744 / CCUG 35717) TaxID=645127 RepID=HIS1_CORK4|nr:MULTISPECIES: ATP phosphoribosyltransferase [Corynebacterium]C4LIL5.1 RecName: Full=ATP phosphoribosyltransferase; Short=ATP-PRT; Short=ATP-PRTase [Corynebacterium kroppenstedtii DSM 44385]ACR17670.1 ATP phosphoribosyltransferase [Corynebacterium kroppenstedtii DSM 44385]MDO4915022.1 ATP phosphoribosyltransferase [Corynebacterium sp.]QRP10884.1 ATP phosphoribosyltransferase [Corynebacterium kroppenstedtii]HJD68886.1 ATP phosphoribosyltransferase [Corynebacterium kroppenstedtii]